MSLRIDSPQYRSVHWQGRSRRRYTMLWEFPPRISSSQSPPTTPASSTWTPETWGCIEAADDVFIALIPVPKENFSFGRGELHLALGS